MALTGLRRNRTDHRLFSLEWFLLARFSHVSLFFVCGAQWFMCHDYWLLKVVYGLYGLSLFNLPHF